MLPLATSFPSGENANDRDRVNVSKKPATLLATCQFPELYTFLNRRGKCLAVRRNRQATRPRRETAQLASAGKVPHAHGVWLAGGSVLVTMDCDEVLAVRGEYHAVRKSRVLPG